MNNKDRSDAYVYTTQTDLKTVSTGKSDLGRPVYPLNAQV